MYISLYVVVNTFIGGRQPQNKLMRLRAFKNILAIPSRQEGLTSHKTAAPFLHYCAFFTGMPILIISPSSSQSSLTPYVVLLALPWPSL